MTASVSALVVIAILVAGWAAYRLGQKLGVFAAADAIKRKREAEENRIRDKARAVRESRGNSGADHSDVDDWL